RTAPLVAVNLGVELVERLNDARGARSQFLAAAASGDPEASPKACYNLGLLLEHEIVDLPGAREAYRSAAASGHREVAGLAGGKLAAILLRMGDSDGARVAEKAAASSPAPRRVLQLGSGPGIEVEFHQYLTCELGTA